MKKYFIQILSISILIMSFASDVNAAEEKPHISDLRLRQGELNVLLSARLVTEFGEEVREALRGGVPLTFSYRIHMTRKGSILGEKIVRRREIIHTLEYDPVKQLYMFKGDGDGRVPLVRTTKD